jgi:hypothetical protein
MGPLPTAAYLNNQTACSAILDPACTAVNACSLTFIFQVVAPQPCCVCTGLAIMSVTVYASLFALVALIVYRLRKVGRRPAGYPPGPPTLPLIGNLHLMPKEKGHLQFQKWADKYGPVYSLILGTKVMVVLSSDQAIKDLLDKRSGIYSSRPDMYLGGIVSGGLRMLLMVRPRSLPQCAFSYRQLTTLRSTARLGA